MGSSAPLTLTTKFPFAGFSLLISTVALEPTAFSIFAARALNAPHCLQASIVTVLAEVMWEERSSADADTTSLFFEIFLLGADALFAGAGDAFFVAPEADRVMRPMIALALSLSYTCYEIGHRIWPSL